MASSTLKFSLILLVYFIFMIQFTKSTSDYSALIYNNCATASQTLTSPADSYSQTLSSLFQDLVAHSSQSKFFRTTEGNDDVALSGLFQCRGDISIDDCYNCVIQLPKISNSLCKDSTSARVQLQGCYVRYEPDDGANEIPDRDLLHKICGEPETAFVGGFKEELNAAFAALEDGIARSDDGFYATNYKSLEAMAQCEGDLGGCDCVECVGKAVQIAEEECGGSASAQIYLDKCYLSVTCHPDGVPLKPGEGRNNNARKSVAIVLGGAAALGLGAILFVFLKSCGRKDDD